MGRRGCCVRACGAALRVGHVAGDVSRLRSHQTLFFSTDCWETQLAWSCGAAGRSAALWAVLERCGQGSCSSRTVTAQLTSCTAGAAAAFAQQAAFLWFARHYVLAERSRAALSPGPMAGPAPMQLTSFSSMEIGKLMVLALPLGGEGVFPEASSFVTSLSLCRSLCVGRQSRCLAEPPRWNWQ